MGMHAEACKNISRHAELDETFYIVDLGNVLRMYKVMTVPLCAAQNDFLVGASPLHLHHHPCISLLP